MHRRFILYSIFSIVFVSATAQPPASRIDSLTMYTDVKVTVDYPAIIRRGKQTVICLYALPNGNTTAQTMGKKMQPGDDWHYDIQHIKAQTAFIRKQDKRKNYIVIYLETKQKSWPAWKQQHADYGVLIPTIVDSLQKLMPGERKTVYLNGHSGGGSFIFGYMKGVEAIPSFVRRISFLDSNYGYDSSYYLKMKQWLQSNPQNRLNVFAYNDSVALYNGKPVVSATGGTWYRSHLMLAHLEKDLAFNHTETDSFFTHKSMNGQVQFYLKKNLNRGIYHTQQVELNGFIHSVFCGTKHAIRRYNYYTTRAYSAFIE